MKFAYISIISVFSMVLFSCEVGYDFSDTILARNFYATIDENPPNGFEIGKIDASSSYGRMNFEILEQNPAGAFTVSEKKGVLTVLDSTHFDFESDSLVTGRVRISNDQMADTVIVEITLIDVVE